MSAATALCLCAIAVMAVTYAAAFTERGARLWWPGFVAGVTLVGAAWLVALGGGA